MKNLRTLRNSINAMTLCNLKNSKNKNRNRYLPELKQVDEHIFAIDYKHDYNLNEILNKGIGNVGKLLIAMQKQLRGGCTTFNAWTEDGDHIFARNFDYKEAPCVVVWTHPKNGYASVGMTDANFMLYAYKLRYPAKAKRPLSMLAAPYMTMDGVNEKGLAIAVLEIKAKSTHQDTGKPKITTPVIIRAVLDTCETVDDAIKLFEQYDMQDSVYVNYHFQIADRSGASVIIEYIDNNINVLRAGDCKYFPERWQYCLNFFVQEGGDNRKGVGYTRQKMLLNTLSANDGVMSESDAMQLLSDCRLHYRHKYLRHMVISLWSAVYNTKESSMLLSAGMDYNRQYKFYVDKPGYIEKV